MKEILRHNFAILTVLLGVILLPFLPWAIQPDSRPSASSIAAVQTRMEQQFAEKLGPPRAKEYGEFYKKEGPKADRDTLTRLISDLDLIGVPAFEDEAEKLRAGWDPFFSAFKAVRSTGVDYVPLSQFRTPFEKHMNFGPRLAAPFLLWTLGRVRCALARQQALKGHWENYIEEMEDAGEIFDAGMAYASSGFWAHDKGTYELCREAQKIPMDAPRFVEERMLQLIRRRREADQDDGHFRLMLHAESMRFLNGTLGFDDIAEDRWTERGRILEIVSKFDLTAVRSSEGVNWRRSIKGVSYRPWDAQFLIAIRGSWTSVPAALKWMGEVSASEPKLKSAEYWGFDPQGVDPYALIWTREGSYSPYCMAGDGGRSPDEFRVTARATEAGLAARLLRRDRGVWPSSIKDVVPEYLPAISPYSTHPQKIGSNREMVRFREKAPFSTLERAWLSEYQKGFTRTSESVKLTAGGAILRYREPNVLRPLRWIALQQRWDRHPFTKSTKLQATYADRIGEQATGPRDLDSDFARRVTEGYELQEKYEQARQAAAEAHQPPPPMPPRSVPGIAILELTVELQFPKEIFYVQPESYDYAVEGISRLVFPEGYLR